VNRAAVIQKLGEAAREQAGYVSHAQARKLGLKTDDLVRLTDQGDLRRVTRGVYALPGIFPGPREPVIAAWLRLLGARMPWERESGAPAAVASHTTAASIHNVGTFQPFAPTFTVAKRRNQPPGPSLRTHVTQLEPADWRWVDLPEGIRIPVTTPARTIVDLAWAGDDHDHVLDALADATSADLATIEEVRAAIGRRRRRAGRGSVAWLDEALAVP
jgi:predicted transcriptional regulator of viral defense system